MSTQLPANDDHPVEARPERKPLPPGVALHRAAWVAVVLIPVFAFPAMIYTLGEGPLTWQVALLPAAFAVVCSVGSVVVSRRLFRLGPALVVLILGGCAGVGMWQDAHPGNGGIPANQVAVSVTYFGSSNARCSIPSDLRVSAGDHMLFVIANSGTTVTVSGPDPRTDVVTSYTRPEESGGEGPLMHLTAGRYTFTCSWGGYSATTHLTVAP